MNHEHKKFTLYRSLKTSTTTKQVLKFVAKASSRAINKSIDRYVDSQAQNNKDLSRKFEIYSAIHQSQNLIASLTLNSRRVQKSIESYERVMATGKPDSHLRTMLDWIEIHALFVWEVIWGAVSTFLYMIFTIVVQLVVTVAVTALIFWLIWWFIML